MQYVGCVKFMFSKKATTIDKIFTVHSTVCSKCQIEGEDFVNFCGFLRKCELYLPIRTILGCTTVLESTELKPTLCHFL